MKLLRCLGCGTTQEVEGAVERVWCIECVLNGDNDVTEEGGTIGGSRSARTERHQRRLV